MTRPVAASAAGTIPRGEVSPHLGCCLRLFPPFTGEETEAQRGEQLAQVVPGVPGTGVCAVSVHLWVLCPSPGVYSAVLHRALPDCLWPCSEPCRADGGARVQGIWCHWVTASWVSGDSSGYCHHAPTAG